jgi:hypothetical protein
VGSLVHPESQLKGELSLIIATNIDASANAFNILANRLRFC